VEAETGKPRGEYRVYTGKEKAEIVKRAAVYGISATIRYYTKIEPVRSLLSSSVFDWIDQYQKEVQKLKHEGKGDFEITELPRKKERSDIAVGHRAGWTHPIVYTRYALSWSGGQYSSRNRLCRGNSVTS